MASKDQDKRRGAFERDFAVQLGIFDLLNVGYDRSRIGDDRNPSVEVVEGASFVPCDYYQALRVHADWQGRVEEMITAQMEAEEAEQAKAEGRKVRKVEPHKLDEGRVFFPVKGRCEIHMRDRHGSVIDVANPICFQPDPSKRYDLVVAWSTPRGGRRHGKALPVFPERLSEKEWVEPVEGTPNSVEDVIFYPSFDGRGRRRGVEWAAIHTSGMRIVLSEKYQPAELGAPLRVALWVWRGVIHAHPIEQVEEDPSALTGEGLTKREGPSMADDEIIHEGRIVSVWEVLKGFDETISPEIEEKALKNAKRRLSRAYHPDKYAHSPAVIQRSKASQLSLIVSCFDKIAELRGAKAKPGEEEGEGAK